jgi:hypothetical protein
MKREIAMRAGVENPGGATIRASAASFDSFMTFRAEFSSRARRYMGAGFRIGHNKPKREEEQIDAEV